MSQFYLTILTIIIISGIKLLSQMNFSVLYYMNLINKTLYTKNGAKIDFLLCPVKSGWQDCFSPAMPQHGPEASPNRTTVLISKPL